jgi:hypothetical protein
VVADNPNLSIPPPPGSTQAKVEQALYTAERKAWMSLAGYKFWMFGYHAAQWVLLKSLLPIHVRNPFASLVRLAKGVVAERGYEDEDHG